MIKAAFFDIDGTLLSHTLNKVPESALDAIFQMRKKGIKVFTSTGRHPLEMEAIPVEMNWFDGWMMLNGAYVYNQEKVISTYPILASDIEILLKELDKHPIPTAFSTADRIYMNIHNDLVRQAQDSIHTPVPVLGDLRDGLHEPVYCMMMYAKNQEYGEVLKRLKNIVANSWHEGAVDVYSKDAGKDQGILDVCKEYGISIDEVIAFGDGHNDVDMVEVAGIGVAVGNGEETVKKVANYIAPPIDEDGIYVALKHFDLVD